MDSSSILRPFLYGIPIFPLPKIVFFPHTTLPLHVFEERYRVLVEDALKQGLPIAMARLQENREPNFDERRPPVHQVAGAGFIKEYRRLPDGRFLLELYGAGRVRLEEELPLERPYRRFRSSLVTETLENESSAQEKVSMLKNLLLGFGVKGADVARELLNEFGPDTPLSAVADVCAGATLADADARQAFLEEVDVHRRLDSVTAHLTDLWADILEASSDLRERQELN
ncbi:MAG: LON peptidase substrate-binding domain-containing protein [Polyangiaceae bacterium]|nr:LON peptidase substrate-binding domain-containing protein [Polyangiaceae bacterium]